MPEGDNLPGARLDNAHMGWPDGADRQKLLRSERFKSAKPTSYDKVVNVRDKKVCEHGECDRKVHARGLCGAHYARRMRGSLSDSPIATRGPRRDGECVISWCHRKQSKSKYCAAHQTRSALGKDMDAPLRPRKPSTPGEEWKLDAKGYVRRYIVRPDGARKMQWQHRVVMEGQIGRPLRKGENVHHINGVRHDNRPENLELWVKTQPAGQRARDLVQWAREIIDSYGGMF